MHQARRRLSQDSGTIGQHLVDHAVLYRFFGRHETVAIGVQLEPGTILPGSTTEPTPAPTPSIAERICSTPPIFGTPRSYYFVALQSGHLGDRAVTTLDGTPLSVEVIE